ncbi:MAG: serine hydrolase [Pedobacter sp.]|nr:serine hydrolase [Chitinophagaceae bacterium]
MQKYLPAALLLFISSVLFAQNNTTTNQIDSVLSVLHAQHQYNGTVLYAEKGKVLYKKAFGIADFRTSAALQTSSAFNLASVSKQFISMCIMILKEKGALSYDDDIQKFIPEFPYQNITIRNLMTHTSGLPDYQDLFVKTREPLETLTNEGMIKIYETLKPPLNFATGTKWEYCNTGYVLLASVIERVSKISIEKFINKYIVLPLGLSETYMYNINLTAPKNHVYGFEEINGKQKLNDLFFLDGVMGDGNMYASVEDLYKWEQSLYSEKLVKKATFADALKPVFLKDGSIYPYGFGWFIGKENEYYFHSGSWAGFYNIICRDTKNNRTLVILSNGSNSTALKIARNIFEEKPFTLPAFQLITNVRVIDGTNTPERKASVRIKDNIILAVGDLKPYRGETIIDGGGKILTPGFIDTHSHLDEFLKNKPDALPALSQGITTVVGGQDGYSNTIDSTLSDIKAKPIAINMATYTGHATLRKTVMGDSNLHRTATNAELDLMKKNLVIEMEKGSLGLSTGLEYEDMHFSSRNEVIELAKIASLHHGRYISHMRSEDIGLTDAIDEIINVGREAKLPVQISHFKIALKSYWGTAANIIAQLESARQEGINITADCYPYEHWASTLRVLFPKTDYSNLQSAQFAIDETIDPTGSILPVFAPNKTYEGKTISEIAAMRNETEAKTLISLIAMVDDYEKKNPLAKNVEVIIGKSMNDADVQQLLSWSNTNLCSDGSDGGHPRSFGAFTRFLGKYVRDKKIVSLENAIQKMTSLAAEHTGIVNRGVIAPGFYADLVLLDPATVQDMATFQNPTALSEGIIKVWVNGKISYENKQSTHQYSGMFLKRIISK